MKLALPLVFLVGIALFYSQKGQAPIKPNAKAPNLPIPITEEMLPVIGFKTMNFQTLDVDFQPIAMDVFAAPEKLHISGEAFQPARDGGLPIWGKLVLALGAGLFLLGIVLLFFRVRRKKKGPFARQEVGPTPAAVQ